MEQVISNDGTPIALHQSGTGSPLVLVHGTGAANPRDWPAFPALEKHFSVCAIDRRGRGASGDSNNYAIEREFEDIAAVVDANGEPANLLGHSFGGVCALGGALRAANVRRLVLYEGIPIPGVPMFPEGIIDRLQALLDRGDRERLLTTFYREVVRLSPDEVKQRTSSPEWPARLASAHTLPREMRAIESYEFNAQHFKDFQTPTLLLLGGDSPEWVKTATDEIDAVLPNSRIAVIPEQQHGAMYDAPDLFVQEVLAFLSEPS
jgi:pimeloyl-ACP methyl ester carboxylesterase